MSLVRLIADQKRDLLLQLELEELAWELLTDLVAGSQGSQRHLLNRRNYLQHVRTSAGAGNDEPLEHAIVEAWAWLERELMTAPAPDQTNEWVIVTRRGRRLQSRSDFDRYRFANALPKGQLHPVLADKVWPTFLRGDYDTAVFQAYREVEIAVRAKSGLSTKDIGTDLMRKAFSPGAPLADPQSVPAEQEALAHLFAGAIGTYKNPQSHRGVNLDDPQEAAEIIVFASQLLRIVDRR